MLKIYFGDMPGVIYNTEVYFRNRYEPDWLTTDLARLMIQDIDRSTVVSPNCIDSPVLGQIPPEYLSGGVKTLLLMLNDDSRIFNASTCGDNCAKWILRIAEKKDLTIRLGHLMNFGELPFEIMILNNDSTVRNMEEMLICAHEFL